MTISNKGVKIENPKATKHLLIYFKYQTFIYCNYNSIDSLQGHLMPLLQQLIYQTWPVHPH